MSPIKAKMGKKPKVSRSSKAGLKFPVGRLDRLIRRGHYGERVAKETPVFLAAVLEYLAAEVLKGAGNCAKGSKKRRIGRPGVSHNEGLPKFFENVTISGGGITPHIERHL